MRRRPNYPSLNVMLWVGSLFLTWTLPAQSTVPSLLECIRQGKDAQGCLQALWQSDSTQTYLVAEAVKDNFEALGKPLSHAQADTLLRIYAIGQAHDPRGPNHWLVQRALFAQGHEDYFAAEVQPWSIEAIIAAPIDVPHILVGHAGHRLAEAYRSKQLSLNAAAQAWAIVDRALLLRQMSDGHDAAEWAKLRAQLTMEMRSALPDCNALFSSYSQGISVRSLDKEGCEAFLIVYQLQGCDQVALWESAWEVALKAAPAAWLYRIAGTEAFNRSEWATSRNYWQQACNLEAIVQLQAHDLLQIAATYRAQGDYRQARSCLQQAMQRQPSWGEPYLHLIDLYQVGSESCALTEFERKALNWLLVELCQKLKSVDENYALEADMRFYQYLQACPTTEEATFLGWKPGDTYPIKCWMSTATTVYRP